MKKKKQVEQFQSQTGNDRNREPRQKIKQIKKKLGLFSSRGQFGKNVFHILERKYRKKKE